MLHAPLLFRVHTFATNDSNVTTENLAIFPSYIQNNELLAKSINMNVLLAHICYIVHENRRDITITIKAEQNVKGAYVYDLGFSSLGK